MPLSRTIAARRHLMPATVLALVFAIALALAGCGGGGSAEPPAPEFGAVEFAHPKSPPIDSAAWGPIASDQIIVLVAEGAGAEAADAAAKAAGGTVAGRIEFIGAYQIAVASTDETGIARAVAKASAVGGVEAAAPSQMATARAEVRGEPCSPVSEGDFYQVDDGRGAQAMDLIGAERAWHTLAVAGVPLSPVTVGVLDEPVGTLNAGLSGPVIFEDVTPRKERGRNSHGDSVTSLIANNPQPVKRQAGGVGLAAVPLRNKLKVVTTDIFGKNHGDWFPTRLTTAAPTSEQDQDVSIGYVREGDERGTYSIGPIAAALEQIRRGATVINCSWGYDRGDPGITRAYKRFFEKMNKERPGVVFVCAAPNASGPVDGDREWPSGVKLPNVITVGNIGTDGEALGARVSDNYELSLVAPGEALGGGTSHAAPQVTSAVAMLQSLDPKLTAADIKRILTGTASTTMKRFGKGEPVPVPADASGHLLSIDNAVLEVVNKLRVAAGMTKLTLEDVERFYRVDLVASSDGGGAWGLAATAVSTSGAPVDLTVVAPKSVTVSGPSPQAASSGAPARWTAVPPGSIVTVHVKRADTGGCARVDIGQSPLAGKWKWTRWWVRQYWSPSTGVILDRWVWNPYPKAETFEFYDDNGRLMVRSGWPKQAEVTIEGDTVRFAVIQRVTNGDSWTSADYEGVIDGDTIQGTAVYASSGIPNSKPPNKTAAWVATRVK